MSQDWTGPPVSKVYNLAYLNLALRVPSFVFFLTGIYIHLRDVSECPSWVRH